MNNIDRFSNLPVELQLVIAGYLCIEDLLRLLQSGKQWYHNLSGVVKSIQSAIKDHSIYHKRHLYHLSLEFVAFRFELIRVLSLEELDSALDTMVLPISSLVTLCDLHLKWLLDRHPFVVHSLFESNPALLETVDKAILLDWAVGTVYEDLALWLLKDNSLDRIYLSDKSLIVAIKKDNQAILKSLVKDSRINHQMLFQWAVKLGNIKLVGNLLHKIDPSFNRNEAIRYASQFGYCDIVKLLLSDTRVDPSDMGDKALRSASHNGHENVVSVLLSDLRVDPLALDADAMLLAAQSGHINVLEIFLEDERVCGRLDGHRLMLEVIRRGKYDVVAFLLSYDCIDPSQNRNEPLQLAKELRLSEIAVLLQSHHRFSSDFPLSVNQSLTCFATLMLLFSLISSLLGL